MAEAEKKDENPSMHLHEVLAMEFRALHHEPPPGTSEPVPLAKEADAEKAREAKQAQEQKQQEHLRAIWAEVHALPENKKQAALCISGGGIRSATFALGVLQGLARCGLLEKFHYLSTVSGGGYIGGWLTAWIQRADGGLGEVSENLAKPRQDARPNPEPVEMQNLRSYSNYLSPRLGLLSADTWTLVATYFRNLLLNWIVLIPLLAAVLTIPWIYLAVMLKEPPPYTSIPLWLGAAFLIVGVAYMGIDLPATRKDGKGKEHERSEKSFLWFCLLPLFLGAVFMTTYWAWFTTYGGKTPEWPFLPGLKTVHTLSPFLWFGVVVHVLAWAVSLLRIHGFRPLEFLAVIASGAIGGTLLWVAAFKLFPQPLSVAELYGCLAIPLFIGLFLIALVAFAGLSSRWTGDPEREWWARANGWLLILAGAWAVGSGLVIFGPWALNWAISAITGAIAGFITILASRSSAIPANEKQHGKPGLLALIFSKATSFAAIVFIAVLVILIIRATTWLAGEIAPQLGVVWNLETKSKILGETVHYLNIIFYTPWWLITTIALGLAFFGILMACVINPNRFSLHAMYRDRLIRAYLGASNRKRDPHPFTGFDEKDNPRMHGLWREEKFHRKLLPVVNIALNLVHGSKLAWQERKAASFTVSPLHCGSYAVGYRKTDAPPGRRFGSDEDVSPPAQAAATPAESLRYGGQEGISLGTAIAISGAAASPNMGYHSSPLVTFILTLLNVRLGAWLGNPGPAGHDTFQLGYPKFSVRPLIAEAFGLTDESNRYVYLSDGGHFENLGLYEMVLRRCHFIVVSDAGQDPACSFADLGGAVRKIRIDLGIPIEFGPMSIFARSDEEAQNTKGRSCAIGKIRYSVVDQREGGPKVDDGVLIYIKPACYGQEPRDIYEYFKSNIAFPHESTADQFFSESQFESYRMLGVYTLKNLWPGEDPDPEKPPDFKSFAAKIEEYLATSASDGSEKNNALKNPNPCPSA
ncbi:MAG TPA: patatin-like phospholipase family protein [Chthoniobacterales bacterium]|nr:patatin-like phospholipase family protein [Chthoniobacterales bacterium]